MIFRRVTFQVIGLWLVEKNPPIGGFFILNNTLNEVNHSTLGSSITVVSGLPPNL